MLTSRTPCIAAFCIPSLKPNPIFTSPIHQRHLPRKLVSSLASDLSDNGSKNDDRDWFLDGREAARLLKLELGITSETGEQHTDETNRGEKSKEETSKMSQAVLESGRAAARELLRDMGMGGGDSEMEEVMIDVDDENNDSDAVSNGISSFPLHEVEAKEVASKVPESKVESTQENDTQRSSDHFSFPSRKSHCMTICMVPPPSATDAWEKLSSARRECRDPGFYRWPPHANLLYPFLEPILKNPKSDSGEEEGGESPKSKEEKRAEFLLEVSKYLSRATEQISPFDVTIDSFGIFGGKTRGVLWAYPTSKYVELPSSDGNQEEKEPLKILQRLLEDQFPMCKEQRKHGQFRPHMTISHYLTGDDATSAKVEVESKWEPTTFHVPEIYMLERRGDDGQFKIVATIPLGPGSEVQIHDPPISFPGMPLVEEEWVRTERMGLKKRRNGRGRRRSKSRNKDDTEANTGSK